MSDYRRNFVPGGMYFFTLVTSSRRPILTTDEGRRFLRNAIQKVVADRPFFLFATVLLPDHWHLVLQLPPSDPDYSVRLKRIKEEFTLSWRDANLAEAPVTQAQWQKGERGIWQPRFWEHTIRDELDLQRCVDYIHWNPRKHRLRATCAGLSLVVVSPLRDSGSVRLGVGRDGARNIFRQRPLGRTLGNCRNCARLVSTDDSHRGNPTTVPLRTNRRPERAVALFRQRSTNDFANGNCRNCARLVPAYAPPQTHRCDTSCT